MIDSNRCPAAVESEDGTVQEEIRTSITPVTDSILPRFFALPLTASQMPIGTKIRGIQNQMAASTIESMAVTATPRFMNITGNLAFSGLIRVFLHSVTTK